MDVGMLCAHFVGLVAGIGVWSTWCGVVSCGAAGLPPPPPPPPLLTPRALILWSQLINHGSSIPPASSCPSRPGGWSWADRVYNYPSFSYQPHTPRSAYPATLEPNHSSAPRVGEEEPLVWLRRNISPSCTSSSRPTRCHAFCHSHQ
jgi:hypothetical protein